LTERKRANYRGIARNPAAAAALPRGFPGPVRIRDGNGPFTIPRKCRAGGGMERKAPENAAARRRFLSVRLSAL
jgi:hypothetical protein